MSENLPPDPPDAEPPDTDVPPRQPDHEGQTNRKKKPWYSPSRLHQRLPEFMLVLVLGLTTLTSVTVRKVYQNGDMTRAVAAEQAGLRKKVDDIAREVSSGSHAEEGQDQRASLLLELIKKMQQVVANLCTPKEIESSMKVYVERLDKSYATLYNSRIQFPHSASDDHATRVALERLKANIRELIDRLDKSTDRGRPEIHQLQSWLWLASGYVDALLALIPEPPVGGIRWQGPGLERYSYLRAAATEGGDKSGMWKTSEAVDGVNDTLEYLMRVCAPTGR